MPIYRLSQTSAFQLDEIHDLAEAFEAICGELNLGEDDKASRERVAVCVMDCAERGSLDPLQIRALVLARLKLNSSRGLESSRAQPQRPVSFHGRFRVVECDADSVHDESWRSDVQAEMPRPRRLAIGGKAH
jgi:hypothetical protein